MSSIFVSALRIASFVFFARAILSWFPIGHDSPVAPLRNLIHDVTEPVLNPIRRALPQTGGFDLSVIIVIVVINFFLIPIVRQL